MTPWAVDLVADRWTPFADTFQFLAGVDLTGASVRVQVRRFPDEVGSPLIDVSGEPGLTVTVSYDANDIATSRVRLQISEATLEGLLAPGAATVNVGSDLRLAWDMHITVPGIGKRRWIAGAFILRAGVTQ